MTSLRMALRVWEVAFPRKSLASLPCGVFPPSHSGPLLSQSPLLLSSPSFLSLPRHSFHSSIPINKVSSCFALSLSLFLSSFLLSDNKEPPSSLFQKASKKSLCGMHVSCLSMLLVFPLPLLFFSAAHSIRPTLGGG